MQLHLAGCVVEDANITHYLLDDAHRIGGAKSRFFQAYGFSMLAWRSLRDALAEHPVLNEVVQETSTLYETKFVVECHLPTPDGRNPCIRTVWHRATDSGKTVLVTAYPT